jgi:hypothetical protein
MKGQEDTMAHHRLDHPSHLAVAAAGEATFSPADHRPARVAAAALLVAASLVASPVRAQFSAGLGDDVRLTAVGGSGSVLRLPAAPDVALDPLTGNSLVVWSADDPDFGLAQSESEIFARVFAPDGSPVSTILRVSLVVPAGDPLRGATDPAVAYHPGEGTYVVVWSADDAAYGLGDQESEIFSRAIAWDAVAGSWAVGAIHRVSDLLAAGAANRGARFPHLAFGAAEGEMLVVWQADDAGFGLADNEEEIFARLVDDEGAPVDGVMQLSVTGPPGENAADANSARVAYDPVDQRFQVVWSADPISETWADNHREIFGRQVHAVTGDPLAPATRLTQSGPSTSSDFGAGSADIVWDPTSNAFYLVFHAVRDAPGIGPHEGEIYGRPLVEPLPQPTRLSQMGPDGDWRAAAITPRVAWDGQFNELLVVWRGHHTVLEEGANDLEVWGRSIAGNRLDPELGPQRAVSDMGGTSATPAEFRVGNRAAAIAAAGPDGRFFVVWQGEDDGGGMIDDELELFGEAVLAGNELLVDGFEGSWAWYEEP